MMMRTQFLLVCALAVASGGGLASVLADEPTSIAFDAPATIVAEAIHPDVVEVPTMGGDLIRLRIPISTFQHAEFRGAVSEYVVEFESPYQSMRIIDFWPKSEMYTEIDGTVSVESSRQRDNKFGFNLSAGHEPIARGSAQGEFHNKSNVAERYHRKPPMQVVTSSGTIRRGFGVFFKFRLGPMPVLEGMRDVAILAEVPRGWRADMLQVTMRAVGTLGAGHSRPRQLGEARLWMTTHREGDFAAAALATRYVNQERSLRALAASSHSRVVEKSLPTLWHKVGATLDVIQPKIPGDYLVQVIFGLSNYCDVAINHLPVELQVAVLDYLDARNALVSLAAGHLAATDRESGRRTEAVHVTLRD